MQQTPITPLKNMLSIHTSHNNIVIPDELETHNHSHLFFGTECYSIICNIYFITI